VKEGFLVEGAVMFGEIGDDASERLLRVDGRHACDGGIECDKIVVEDV